MLHISSPTIWSVIFQILHFQSPLAVTYREGAMGGRLSHTTRQFRERAKRYVRCKVPAAVDYIYSVITGRLFGFSKLTFCPRIRYISVRFCIFHHIRIVSRFHYFSGNVKIWKLNRLRKRLKKLCDGVIRIMRWPTCMPMTA